MDPFNPDNCPRLLWASFAFVNNMLPFAGCASHTWSTAVQMQFFLLAPLCLLLLRPKSPGFRCAASKTSLACIFKSRRKHSYWGYRILPIQQQPRSLFCCGMRLTLIGEDHFCW